MSKHWSFFLIPCGEVVFFIVDQWMKHARVIVHLNQGWITHVFPVSLVVILGVGSIIVCCIGIVRAWRVHSHTLAHAFLAVLLGVASGILDLWQVHAFIDWIMIGQLAFNGGDILIISGIVGILITAAQKH